LARPASPPPVPTGIARGAAALRCRCPGRSRSCRAWAIPTG